MIAMSWAYKEEPGVLREMWEIIRSKAAGVWEDGPTPANDDQFDAAIGYILGRVYAEGGESGIARVAILGDRRAGAFLLPDVRQLRRQWERWMSADQSV